MTKAAPPAVPAPIVPGQIKKATYPRIENWRQVGDRVAGAVYDHQDYPDGSDIITSTVLTGELAPGATIGTYSGSTYVLGAHE